MLKLLLLLCWATIFVSAGDEKNAITNNTSVSTGSIGNNVAVNPQLLSTNTKLPTLSSNEDTYLPSAMQTKSPMSSLKPVDVHQDIKPITVTDSSENLNTSATKVTTKPTTKLTTITTIEPTTQVPTTIAPTSTTPLPPPSTGKWNITENKKICIVVQMAVQFNVSLKNNANKTIYMAMDIPKNSNATGKCGPTEQNLTLSWGAAQNFTLHFVKNETKKHYSLHHFEISLATGELSPNVTTVIHMTPQFDIALNNSYRCFKKQQLNLSLEGKNETIGHLTVSEFQFQAFRNDNTTNFGLAQDCAFDTPDIVPITVGCALAVLVVIVLLAYLIGRRRSQARGYLSM